MTLNIRTPAWFRLSSYRRSRHVTTATAAGLRVKDLLRHARRIDQALKLLNYYLCSGASLLLF